MADLVGGYDTGLKASLTGSATEFRTLRVSVVSLGSLKGEFEDLDDAEQKEIWAERFGRALAAFQANQMIVDVDESTALEWASIRNMDLPIATGEQLSSDERIVVATAITRNMTLATSVPEIYQPIAKVRDLRIQPI